MTGFNLILQEINVICDVVAKNKGPKVKLCKIFYRFTTGVIFEID